ncbi:MAG: hypothetical protein GJ680_07605 [Alteromonadaceae bacterium]|nr:hypothetical protein [Alteromonadaceae bacterium]
MLKVIKAARLKVSSVILDDVTSLLSDGDALSERNLGAVVWVDLDELKLSGEEDNFYRLFESQTLSPALVNNKQLSAIELYC